MSNALFATLKNNKILLSNITKINIKNTDKFFNINICFNDEILINKYIKHNDGKYYSKKHPQYISENVSYLLPYYNKDLKKYDILYKDIDILKKITNNITVDIN